jgi:hypothetical protein
MDEQLKNLHVSFPNSMPFERFMHTHSRPVRDGAFVQVRHSGLSSCQIVIFVHHNCQSVVCALFSLQPPLLASSE